MRDFLIVGLTGTTGSGKSTVSREFEKAGFGIINADEIAREVLEKDSSCLKQLALAFGENVIDPDGTANRREIARCAFSSKENTQLLNEITHPRIFLKTLKRCREYIDIGCKKIVFDAPVLFESNSDIMCDCVVAVTAPISVRTERLMLRDGLPREDIERRILAQKTDEFFEKHADIIIDGGRSLDDVLEQTRSVIAKLCG